MSDVFFAKVGWWLFILSAMLFGWAAIRARDWVAAAGAGAFFIANISFMVPIYRSRNREREAPPQHTTPS